MSQTCRFKLTYTCIVYEYNINIDDSSEQIYLLLSERVNRDFQLDNNIFDIVLAGQTLKEEADPIPRSSESFRSFLDHFNTSSFYIRQNVTRTSRRNVSTTGQCPICFTDEIRICSYYNCSHTMCPNCNNTWRQTYRTNQNSNRCPTCRSV